MKKTICRIVSLILAVVLIFGQLPAGILPVRAAEVPQTNTGLEGKTISILGDSISTMAGVSNNTAYNSTIGKNAVYYSGTSGVTRADTWWQQTIDALGLELLVNNSWSGSCILHTRSGTVGAYVDRCVQLHNDHTGEEPDIIAVFMGTNDFSYYQSALGTAQIDYDSLIRDNGDGTFTYGTPTTSCEAYAIMLHKMTQRYPNAEVYCMNLLARRNPVNSGADVGQPTAFNAALAEIIERYGATLVDLENCGITSEPSNFDLYMGDKRVHPNAAGMDKMTEALVSAMLGKTAQLCHITGNYGGVANSNTAGVALMGGSYSAKLSLQPGHFNMQVTVTMGGADITASAYANGVISIPNVTGDLVITAKADREPANFRWEFDGTDLVSVGNTENTLTKLAGSTNGSVFSNTRYQMAGPVILRHNLPWIVEWKGEGTGGFMLANASNAAATPFFFRRAGNYLNAFGSYDGSQYNNYGIALSGTDIDGSANHVYRLENRIAADGSNMVWLSVDGVGVGALNQYYVAGSAKGTTGDWINGKDFTFSHIGTTSHPLTNYAMEYLQVWEAGEPIEGKTISILGASISTYTGISNNTDYNSTIGSNAIYYTEGRHGVYAADTWWMQAADDLGLELLVNNSWSGSSLLHERNGTVGAYVDRCVQLHNNDGEVPDIIGIQMGTNDFQYYKDTLGTADINYDTLITSNGDGTYTYATPVTSLEAAAIVLHKISVRYPNAEVYYLNISQRIDGTDELIRSFNAELKQVVEHFGAHIVDIYGSAITMDNFDTYIGDGKVHPNCLGMDAYTEAFKRALIENTAYAVKTHTVTMNLDGVTADYGDDKIVVDGDRFTLSLTAADSLQVTVTMGGQDITQTVCTGGTVTIDSVTDDVTITAKSVHESKDYRWEFDGSDLACVEGSNALTKTAGTTTDGVFSKTSYSLTAPVVLLHDQPWAVEWKCSGTFLNANGSSGARIFTSDNVNANYNARYIFKSNTNGIIAMGEKDTAGSHNYGIALADHGIDWTALHTYRLENRIAEDGSNMIYLFVDGEEIGPMNHYYLGTKDQKTTSNWLSGKDFVFPYMGTDTHGFTNASIAYIQVRESHPHSYQSTVTAPTCTEQGYTTHTCACGDSYVDSYVDATGHSWVNGSCTVCGGSKKPYQRLTYFTVQVESDGKTYSDNAVLYLPANYTPDGEPVKLVIYCKQGASQITASSNPIEDVGFYNYLLSLGYAILGVDGVPDAWRDELGICERAVGNPIAVQGTEKAYDYVVDNYNIAADGCFISGYSQGGHYAQNVIDLTDIPILAAAEQSPVCSMQYHQWDLNATVTVNGTKFTKGARLNVARIFGFPAFTTNAELLALAYDPSLVALYDPWVRNAQNVYTGFVQKSNLWYLPDGTDLDDITMTKTVKCPVKIWCAEDDTAISADVMKVFVQAIRNAGGTAEISIAASGGHGFFQKQAAVGTFVENGKTYSTLPIAVEIAQWFAQYGGYECQHSYSDTKCTICGAAKWDTDGDGTLEILAIGNSFSIDALEYAWQIANDLGIEKVVIGNLYIGGCTLATHAANAAGDLGKYTYYYNDNGTWTSTGSYKISTALESRSWDYVSLQQGSPVSGVESTYNEDLTNLIAYVQARSDAKLVWHMTWAYQQNSTHSAFPTYGSDQMTMYNAIVSSVQNKIVTNGDFDLIVPNGTAVQNSRTSLLGDTTTRDGYHMSKDYGRYLTGLMFIKTLTGLDVSGITYAPSGVDAQEMEIAIESVNNAFAKPFEVTQSAYTGQIPEEGYILLETELYQGAFWDPTHAEGYNVLHGDKSNSHQFYATVRFTRETLPVGSIIILEDGWQYRPDGWITDTLQTGIREQVTTRRYVVVTEQWWGDYTIRSFNISKVGLPSLANVTEEEVRAAFRIYVPEDAHTHTYKSIYTEPTCAEAGYVTHICTTCGDTYTDGYEPALGHDYVGITCTVCGAEHPNAADYSGKVISILGDSISTFAGYIPVADGFNLTHLARYPQDNLLTDVNETWWMQTIAELDGKLGINDSWRGSTVSGYPSVTTGVAGYLAAMSNLTQIQNLGSNGTPDVILFYGGTNDLAHTPSLGTFDPATAPTEVDLTTLKWNNLADAYAQILLRLKHFYPNTQIICLLPTYTTSYYSNDKLAQGNALMASICQHYGVTYIDLRDCGISTADLPDGIHPNATGMDYITNAVLETLLAQDVESGENLVHSVTHDLTGVTSSLGYYKGVSDGKAFVTTLTGDDMTVSVTMGGMDITAQVYADGVITIPAVTGDLVITAAGRVKPIYEDHLQQLPDPYYGVDLWKTLEHDDEYFYIDAWTVHSSGNVYSVTFPVTPGDKIVASSFGAAGSNGATMNGIRITWFDTDGVLHSVGPADVYAEFEENGYLTVPEGAVAVNIPMWTNANQWELYVYDSSYEPTFSLGDHLQQLPENVCAGTNLWDVLQLENTYYTGSAWGNLTTNQVWSVTIAVTAGDQIWATSFQKYGSNGNNFNTTNGIRITWFGANGVLKSVSPAETYQEFAANGYITVPEGAVAVNIPMWSGSDSNELYVLSLAHVPGDPVVENQGAHGSHDVVIYCEICGAELSREHDDGYLPGDINGDGEVNNKDLTRLFQYLSDYDVEVVEEALDLNGDGSVNNKDLTRLFQYLSDYEVELH